MKNGTKWIGLAVLTIILVAGAYVGLGADFLGPLDRSAQLADGNTLTATGRYNVVDMGAGFRPKPVAAVGILIDITSRVYLDANYTAILSVQESNANVAYNDANYWTETGLYFTLVADPNLAQTRYLKVTGLTKRYVQLKATLGGAAPGLTLSAWVTRP